MASISKLVKRQFRRTKRAVFKLSPGERRRLLVFLLVTNVFSITCASIATSWIAAGSAAVRFAMVYVAVIPIISVVALWWTSGYVMNHLKKLVFVLVTMMERAIAQVLVELHSHLTPGYLAMTTKVQVVRAVTELLDRAREENAVLVLTGAPGLNQESDGIADKDLVTAIEDNKESMLMAMHSNIGIKRYIRLWTPMEFWDRSRSDSDRKRYCTWVENEILYLTTNPCYILIHSPVAPGWDAAESMITDRQVMVRIVGRGDAATRIRGEQVVIHELDSRIHQIDKATRKPYSAKQLEEYLKKVKRRPLEIRTIEGRAALADAAAELIEQALKAEDVRIVFHGAADLLSEATPGESMSRYDQLLQTLIQRRFPMRRYIHLMEIADYRDRPEAIRKAYDSWIAKEIQLLERNDGYEFYNAARAQGWGSSSNKIITQVGYLEVVGSGEYGRMVIGDGVTRDHKDFFFDDNKAKPKRVDNQGLSSYLHRLHTELN